METYLNQLVELIELNNKNKKENRYVVYHQVLFESFPISTEEES